MTKYTFTTTPEEIAHLIKTLRSTINDYDGPVTVEYTHYEVLKGGGAISFRRADGTALGIAQSETVNATEAELLAVGGVK